MRIFIIALLFTFGIALSKAEQRLIETVECVPAPTQDAIMICPICGGDDFHIMTTVQEPVRAIWMLECSNEHCSHKLDVGRVEG